MSLELISADELQDFADRLGIKPEEPEPEPELHPSEAQPAPYRKICLGLLSYDGTMHCRTFMALAQAMFACHREGWDFDCLLRDGDSMVARGRSFIASQFLENPRLSTATDLMFVDCDITWNGPEFVKLLKHDIGPDGKPVGVVGGAYPFKRDHAAYPMRWGVNQPDIPAPLWEVDAVTPGFMRITRDALELIAGRMPWLEYHEHLAGKDQRTWMFFDNLHRRTGVFDEGYVFCEHWRTVGGKVWLDPDCNLTHIGTKAFNHGTFREHWEAKGQEIERMWKANPDVDPNKVVEAVVREVPLHEVDSQYSVARPAGTPGENDSGDVPQHSAAVNDADDLGGRGRQANGGNVGDDANGAGLAGVDQAAGGFSWGEVRPGADGSAG